MNAIPEKVLKRYNIRLSSNANDNDQGFEIFQLAAYPVFITAHKMGKSKDVDSWFFTGLKSTMMITQELMDAFVVDEKVSKKVIDREIYRFLRINKVPVHLQFDMLWAPFQGIKQGHPQNVMQEIGISYEQCICQSIADQWWFFNCINVPKELPGFLELMFINPLDMVGFGLSEEDAKSIHDNTLNCSML